MCIRRRNSGPTTGYATSLHALLHIVIDIVMHDMKLHGLWRARDHEPRTVAICMRALVMSATVASRASSDPKWLKNCCEQPQWA